MTSIVDAKRNFYALSQQHALASDNLYAVDSFVNIPADGFQYIMFVVSGSPIYMPSFAINTVATLTRVTLYEGGTYSGGFTVTPVNMNLQSNSPPSLVSDFRVGVGVNVPGSLIRIRNIIGGGVGNNRAVVSGGSNIGMIFKSMTTYLIAVENLDAAAQDFDIELNLTDVDSIG